MDALANEPVTVTVEMIADVACPWCYLGLVRLRKAQALRPELSIALRWWPYLLNPQLPRDGMDRRTYLRAKFGGDTQADQIYSHIKAAGDEEGVSFAFDKIERTPNTVLTHRLILLAQEEEKGEQVIDLLFKAMFEEGLDIGNADHLLDVAEAAGLPRENVGPFFSSDRFAADIFRGHQRAQMMGVQGVPVYVVDREHAISGAQPPEVLAGLLDLAGTRISS